MMLTVPDFETPLIDGSGNTCPGISAVNVDVRVGFESDISGAIPGYGRSPSPVPSTSAVSTLAPAPSSIDTHCSVPVGSPRRSPSAPRMKLGKASKSTKQRTCNDRRLGRSSKRQCLDPPISKARVLDPEDEDADGNDDMLNPGAEADERKGPISHSTVEKQRRDRINTLIDLLAEEVPPLGCKYGSKSATGVRRPKHMVLSDTLALLSQIRKTLKDYEHKIATLTSAAATTASNACDCEALQAEDSPAAQMSVETPAAVDDAMQQVKAEICQPDDDSWLSLTDSLTASSLEAAEGFEPEVMVEEDDDGKFLVNLKCLHEPDLLADVADGLSNLPVSIDDASFSDPCPVEGVMHGSLRLSVLPGSCVASEQVQLALCMSLSLGCPSLPFDAVLHDGMPAIHDSPSSDSMESWYAL